MSMIDIDDRMLHEHESEGTDCPTCWPEYPRTCTQEGCDGLVHAEFGDESWDDYWLFYRCLKCRSDYPP